MVFVTALVGALSINLVHRNCNARTNLHISTPKTRKPIITLTSQVYRATYVVISGVGGDEDDVLDANLKLLVSEAPDIIATPQLEGGVGQRVELRGDPALGARVCLQLQ